MERKSFFFMPLFLALFLLSCGKEEIENIPDGHTLVYFTRDQKITLNGGLMIYLQRQNNPGLRAAKFMQNETDTGLGNIVLPNGNYYFTAVGYTLAGPLAVSGQVYYCGVVNNGEPVLLDGGVRTFDISLGSNSSYDFCSRPVFGPASYINTAPNPDTLMLVNKIWDCTSANPAVPVTGSCVGATAAGAAGSVKVHMVSMRPVGPFNDPFASLEMTKVASSPCLTVTSGVATIGFPFLAPVGNGPASPYFMSVESFNDGACTTLRRNYNFPHGISNPGGSNSGQKALSYVNASNIEIYLQD